MLTGLKLAVKNSRHGTCLTRINSQVYSDVRGSAFWA